MVAPIPVADEAVAHVALTTLLTRILATETTTEPNPESMARKVVDTASAVRFQPSTRRLVLTFDLAMSSAEDD